MDLVQKQINFTKALTKCYKQFIQSAKEKHTCPTCSRSLTDAELKKYAPCPCNSPVHWR